MKITILADNHAAPGLECEHGLAMLVEADNRRILFDTGQLGALEANCRSLGIGLSSIDTIVLSHGHYDHTGNLAEVLRQNPQAELYLHPSALIERFSIRNGIPKSISMPEAAKSAIAGLAPEQVHFVTEPIPISEHLFLSGPIARQSPFEDTGGPFFLDQEGALADPIRDDMALWFSGPDGLKVVAGCCHSGIVNTLDHIETVSGQKRIELLIGGLHLSAATTERLEQSVESLGRRTINRIVPCHCTGQSAIEYFRARLPFSVEQGYAGMVVESGER